MDKKAAEKASDDMHELIYKTIVDPKSEFAAKLNEIGERVGLVLLVGAKIGEAGVGIFLASGDRQSMVLAVRNAITEDSNNTLVDLIARAAAQHDSSPLKEEMNNDIRRN